MSIFGNIRLGVTAIAAADTSLIIPADPVERLVISAFSIHSDGSAGATRTVELFLSADTTSAAGDRVAYYSVPNNGSVEVIELIGQGLEVGENIIGKASGTGLNAHITVTNYDGGS